MCLTPIHGVGRGRLENQNNKFIALLKDLVTPVNDASVTLEAND
jgi:hypothetical protein